MRLERNRGVGVRGERALHVPLEALPEPRVPRRERAIRPERGRERPVAAQRFVEAGRGLGSVAARREREAEIAPDRRLCAIERERAPVFLRGGRGVARKLQDIAQIGTDPRAIARRDAAHEHGTRLGEAPTHSQRLTQQVERLKSGIGARRARSEQADRRPDLSVGDGGARGG